MGWEGDISFGLVIIILVVGVPVFGGEVIQRSAAPVEFSGATGNPAPVDQNSLVKPRYVPANGSSNQGASRAASPNSVTSRRPLSRTEQITEIRRQLDEYENAVSELKKGKDGRLERIWSAGSGETGEYSKDDIIKALDNAKRGGPGGNGCAIGDCLKKTGGKWAPAVLAALQGGLKTMGSTCISGARSRADQVRIKKQYPGVGGAAIPGYSRHETCDALDVSGRYCPDGLIKLINETHEDDNPTSHCSTTGG